MKTTIGRDGLPLGCQCDECGKEQATVHLIGKVMQSTRLLVFCDRCARKIANALVGASMDPDERAKMGSPE